MADRATVQGFVSYRRSSLATALVALLVYMVIPVPASAHSQFINIPPGDREQRCYPCYVWTPSVPHYYYVVNAIRTAHPGWRTLIAANVSKWNVAPAGNSTWFKEEVAGKHEMIVDRGNLNVKWCGYTYVERTGGRNSIGWLYLTQTRYKYNDNLTYYQKGKSTGKCEFDWVTLHETGHAGLALGHTDTSSAVMWHEDNRQTTIQPDDIDGLRYLY